MLDLIDRGEEMELDDEDYDEDDTASVMTIRNAKDCIGCGAQPGVSEGLLQLCIIACGGVNVAAGPPLTVCL